MNELAPTPFPPQLDLRGLDPPEPMRRALEAVEALKSGDILQITTDREPLLLHRELDRRGHFHVSESDAEGFRTTIRRSGKEEGAR
jgi:uncharacterized protein (DUF2249 family)